MTDFFDLEAVQDTKRLEKMRRILVYPNITYSKDLTKDSYIAVIQKMIEHLNKIRKDLWFYLILPERLEMLAFENVTQWFVPFPSYPNQMRIHFDSEALYKLFDTKYDFDLVFSHLPEHTTQLVNLLWNKTNFAPKVIGYSHWFEFKNITKYPKNVFPQSVLGILDMESCYVNTEYQKQLVLTEAAEWFNTDTLKRLETIIKPFYLGVDGNDISSVKKDTPKTIVFNHRPHTYKNFDDFMEIMDKLYAKRQDFKVWIPLLEQPNRPYVTTTKFSKREYYQALRNCRVGFAPKQTYGGWSVAGTDGLMNGVPYVMYDAGYYHELWNDASFFKTHDEALAHIEQYLDDNDYRNKQGASAIKHCKDKLLYDYSIQDLSSLIDTTIDGYKPVGESRILKELTKMIKLRKYVSKKKLFEELKWGVGIKFDSYRRALMNDPNIFDEFGEFPTYHYKE